MLIDRVIKTDEDRERSKKAWERSSKRLLSSLQQVRIVSGWNMPEGGCGCYLKSRSWAYLISSDYIQYAL